MRFLIDAQLPPALARHLGSLGHPSQHVVDVGLERATDAEIWNYSRTNSATLVTKDEDFVTLRALQPDGPAIVWIRTGNTTNRLLLGRISDALPVIVAALEREETVVEVI